MSWTIYLLCSTGDGPLTVFAPTNEAIEALPASLVSSLMEDTEMLKQVLLYHVVAGEITSSMADNNIQLPSVAGAPLLVNLYLKSKYYDVSTFLPSRRVHSILMISSAGLYNNQRQEGCEG